MNYSTTPGSYLIVEISGIPGMKFVAIVITEHPLRIIVQERGKYTHFNRREFTVYEDESKRFQSDELRPALLRESKQAGTPIVYGLAVLGITDGEFYEMLPPDKSSSN